ncbi:hypothetical protein OXYTRIMIC_097 [Oxytricha trifallax]|uniref:Uncharacterized protein n=1 Tax=Oxytricha trifallax TaxID=1172189 RepID=A0A073HY70_9SPIT|nr:hypothetical protein OXYTRIMIC_097 [Oxytricha trifallax]
MKLVSATPRMGSERKQRQRVQYLLRHQITMEGSNKEYGVLFGKKRSERVLLTSKKIHKEQKISPINQRIDKERIQQGKKQ